MKYTKFIAAALLLCILLSACGCRYTSNTLVVTDPYATTQPPAATVYQPESTTLPQATDATLPTGTEATMSTLPENTTQPVPTETTVPTLPESTTAPQNTTQPEEASVPESTEPEPTTERNPSTWSKQEIVSFLANAVNKTKAYTGQVTVDRSEDLGITIETITPNLPALKNIANSLVSRFIKPVSEVVTFNGGKGMSDDEEIPLLLPKRQAFTLPPEGVKQASAAKNGNNTVVDITLVEETSSMSNPPLYNSQGLGYLDVNSVDLSMVTIETLDFVYLGSTIHAVIGPDGYVLSAEYHVPLKVSASGKAVGISGAFTGTGYQTEKWDIHW